MSKSKGKENRIFIRLVDPECKKSVYYTMKNKKNSPEKIQINKYNKFLRRYTLHVEVK